MPSSRSPAPGHGSAWRLASRSHHCSWTEEGTVLSSAFLQFSFYQETNYIQSRSIVFILLTFDKCRYTLGIPSITVAVKISPYPLWVSPFPSWPHRAAGTLVVTICASLGTERQRALSWPGALTGLEPRFAPSLAPWQFSVACLLCNAASAHRMMDVWVSSHLGRS